MRHMPHQFRTQANVVDLWQFGITSPFKLVVLYLLVCAAVAHDIERTAKVGYPFSRRRLRSERRPIIESDCLSIMFHLADREVGPNLAIDSVYSVDLNERELSRQPRRSKKDVYPTLPVIGIIRIAVQRMVVIEDHFARLAYIGDNDA